MFSTLPGKNTYAGMNLFAIRSASIKVIASFTVAAVILT